MPFPRTGGFRKTKIKELKIFVHVKISDRNPMLKGVTKSSGSSEINAIDFRFSTDKQVGRVRSLSHRAVAFREGRHRRRTSRKTG